MVAAASGGVIQLWSLSTGTVLRTCTPTIAYNILTIDFSPDGTKLASGNSNGDVVLWNVSDASLIGEFQTLVSYPHGSVHRVKFNRDGSLLLSCCRSGFVYIWDVPTISWKSNTTDHSSYSEVFDVDFNHDNTVLATADKTTRLALWNADSDGTLRSRYKFSLTNEKVGYSLEFNHDGTIFATGSSGVDFRDPTDGSIMYSSPVIGYGGIAYELKFSNDGNILYGISTRKKICLWNTSDGSLIKTITTKHTKSPIAFDISPDESTAVSTGIEWIEKDGIRYYYIFRFTSLED